MPALASFGGSLRAASFGACLLGAALAVPEAARAQETCGVRDWRCLLQQAALDIQKDKQDDGDSHGRFLVAIARAYPEPERVGIAQQFLSSAGSDDDLQSRLERFLVPARLRTSPDVEALRKALTSGVSPEPDFALGEYARMAFEGLIASKDQDTLLKLWREEGRRLWRDAPQAELVIVASLAETAPDALAQSIRDRGLVDGGWEAISNVAERLCRQGSKDKGDALLVLLDGERKAWNSNRSHDASNLASSVMAVAACDGFPAAEIRLDAATRQMQGDIAAIKTHIADPDDAEATIGLLQQAVVETGTRPLIRAYLDAGRTDDARRIFGELPATDAPDASNGVTLDSDGSSGTADAPDGDYGWQAEYRNWAQARSFNPDPQLVLADVDRWAKEDDDNVGVDAIAQMQRTAEALPGFKGDRRGYVIRLKALGERIGALPGAEGMPRQQTEVMLADAELQIAGCNPSDEQFRAWEKSIAAAPDLQTKVDGLVEVARLLRHIENDGTSAVHDKDYGTCVIAKG